MSDKLPKCPNCDNYIDPVLCWCGSDKSHGCENHSFVPEGCTCYFTKKEPAK